MFTYLKLKNFKSFKDIEFDFRTIGGRPNNLIIIYGENGAGKSNLVEAFNFLKDSIDAIRNRNKYERLKDTIDEEDSMEDLLSFEQRIHYKVPDHDLIKLSMLFDVSEQKKI